MTRAIILVSAVLSLSSSVAKAQVFSGAEKQLIGDGTGELPGGGNADEIATGTRLFGKREEHGEGQWRGDLANSQPDSWAVGMFGSTFSVMEAVEDLGDDGYLVMADGYRGRDAYVVLRGLDFSKVTSGVRFSLRHPVVISEMHETDTGERYLVLDARFEAVLGAINKSKFRDWTDSTGKFSVKAKFVQYVNREVTIEKEDGTQVAVPLLKLSPADQKYAMEQHKAASREKK